MFNDKHREIEKRSATERLVGDEEGVVFFKRFMWCSFYILAMIFVIYLLS